MKAKTIAALPIFVANSSRMLVLGDDTYFERLWCNLELAIFAKSSRDPRAVQYMPLWLTPWILSTIFMDVVCITIAPPLETFALDHLTSRIRDSFGQYSTLTFFLVVMLTWIFPGMCYLPASLPSFSHHVRKIQQHEQLLKNMAGFDIRNAKCTLESDREIIENEVLELFDVEVSNAWDPKSPISPTSPVDNRAPWATRDNSTSLTRRERRKRFMNFNLYVRGPLRESVLQTIGQEVDMPWSLCMLCFMPLIFYSAVSVLGCDGNSCDVTAEQVGYDTALQYVVANALAWALGFWIIIPTTHPLLLRMVKIVLSFSASYPTQLCLTVVSSFCAYVWVFTCQGVMTATLSMAIVRFSPYFLAALVVQLGLLLLQLWYFFLRSRVRQPTLEEDCYAEFSA
ncbi:unnamed protein product [Symbiodinium natans]|uniref:Uncharacterized protein n=1 Tax=Symbiodinium natans TaxID=878477 RepID=A0A812NUW6_9DINO|nr:unnamed protein product [Symbiodinium natans]